MTQENNSSAYVYVNGEKMNLLEDGRLFLYHRFPKGTLLYDPSDLPPREVPLSTDAAEHGITVRRLIPYGHYHAFLPDPATGDLHPLTGESICAYVTNLPPNTTAEMFGRYFEAFDMVAEADIFTNPEGLCNGRGWVVLQDPMKLLMIPPLLEFFPRNFIRIALSDRIPSRAVFPPPQAAASSIHALGSVTPSYVDPVVGHGRSTNSKRSGGMSGHGVGPNGAPKPPAALAGGVVNASSYYFAASIQKGEVDKSIEEGVFWPSPANRRAFYSTLERGPVIIIFVLQECPAVFGYARLLSQRDSDTNVSFGCPIEWMKHHVFLQETEMRLIQSVPIAKMGDGIPLKPEIGESICHLADRYPSIPTMSEGLGLQAANGRHAGRGGGFNSIGGGGSGGGVQPIGDRRALRPGTATAAPQPLGARQSTRGGHYVNGANRVLPRRRVYHDSTSSYPSFGGNVVPPRKL
ncbi:hypothetical protein DQ04_01601120 [Trypanosoma grayi]|uniref:hypothetical protein n=1 Tax=Trypanosoma grayi TaxID=71804 RepID=UPI0004F47B18|nr:hypothetical protein DQ04_01601120 [Trypanosoma grayi]KEG12587.1 hypothetical protein DQ04_01601120 [Trypanosoma grayi]